MAENLLYQYIARTQNNQDPDQPGRQGRPQER